MVLDLLGLVVVAYLHLLGAHAFVFFLKSLFFISEDFERHNDFLDLVLSLLEHLFHLFVVVVEALALIPPILFVAAGLCDLPVFDLY